MLATAETAAHARGWTVERRPADRFALGSCDALFLGPTAPVVDAARFAAFPIVFTATAQLEAAGLLQPTPPADEAPDVPLPQPAVVESPGLQTAAFDEAVVASGAALYAVAPQAARCVRGIEPTTTAATVASDSTCLLAFTFSRDAETADGPAPGRRVVALLDGKTEAWAQGARDLLDWSLREVEREYTSATTVTATDLALRPDAMSLSALPGIEGVAVLEESLAVRVDPKAAAPLAAVTAGKVVFGREYGGFLRKVVSVSRPSADRPEYVIETEPAGVADLFSRGRIVIKDEFEGVEPSAAAAPAPDGGAVVQAATARPGNLLQRAARRIQTECKAEFGGIEAKPKVSTSLTGELTLEFADGVGISKAKVALLGSAKASLELSAQPQISGSCNVTATAPPYRFTTQTFVVIAGIPVPVVVQHVIQPGIAVTVMGTAQLPGFTGELGGEVSVGMEAEYKPDTGWTRIERDNRPRAITKMELSDKGTLTVQASATATLSYTAALYGLLGPRAQLILKGEGSFSADTNCDYKAEAKADLSLRLDIARPGVDLECEQDPAVLTDFGTRFGHITDQARQTRDAYLRSRCGSGTVVIGRFPESFELGFANNAPHLYVTPASAWRPHIEAAFLQGGIDRGAEFQAATDPRHVRAVRTSGSNSIVNCEGRRPAFADQLRQLRRARYAFDFGNSRDAEVKSGTCGCLGGYRDPCRFKVEPKAKVQVGWRRLLPEVAFTTRLASASVKQEGRLSVLGCACEPPRMPMGRMCVCPAPLQWANETCACPPNTPVFDRMRNVCEACSGERTWNGSMCVCEAPRVWDGAACSCPEERPFWNERARDCTPCQTGQRVGTRCIECPETQFFDGTSCVCLPPSRLEGDRCVANCTPPATWDGYECRCPQSQPNCNERPSYPDGVGDPSNCNPQSAQAFLRTCRFRMTRTSGDPQCASRPAVEVREMERSGHWFSAMMANRARYGDVCCQQQDVPFLNLGSFGQDAPADYSTDACGTIELLGCTTTTIASPGCN